MNLRSFTYTAAAALSAAFILASCEDEVSTIGSSIVGNEVKISIDSLTLGIASNCVQVNDIDARSGICQLGRFDIPSYGALDASYVTQLLSASSLAVPDSIGVDRVDSTKLVITIPRSKVVGDTTAPQQLTVYRLTKPLPSDLRSDFDPSGYYDAAHPVNSKNYTLSGLNLSDSLFRNATNLTVNVDLPLQWGRDAFTAYRTDPEIFQWPSTFCKSFPGLYISPSFGRGAMANISSTKVVIYYHHFIERTVVENDVAVKKQVTMKDSIALFGSAPEVLSSSLFRYNQSSAIEAAVANGRKIISAPTGYAVDFIFPAEQLLAQYWASDRNLSIINNLTLTFPATSFDNTHGLLPPPDLLMIKKSEIDDFFNEGKIPDNVTSFRGQYSSDNGRYEFASMREYIIGLKDKQGNITPEDLEFRLIPVSVETETSTSSYDGSSTTYIIKCSPFLSRPAVAELFMDRANVVFTFTEQLIK